MSIEAITNYFPNSYGELYETVKLLAWDRDKYVTLQRANGAIEDVKCGYVFATPGDLNKRECGKCISINKLLCLPTPTDYQSGITRYSRKKQQAERKRDRKKDRKVQWSVYTAKTGTVYYPRKVDALKFAATLPDVTMGRTHLWSYEPVLQVDDWDITLFGNCKHIKRRHLKHFETKGN